MEPEKASFIVKDCAIAAIATGYKASSLIEFRDKLAVIDLECVYYHFWGSRLRPQFTHPDYQNDFASWVFHGLNEQSLAEKLGILDPTEYPNLEDLRKEVLDIVDEELEQRQIMIWSRKSRPFHFITSKLILLDTTQKFDGPLDLKAHMPLIPTTSIFYHFIDAKRRLPDGTDDFSHWLKTQGEEYAPLIQNIQAIDYYFLSLFQIKNKLVDIMNEYFK